MKPLLLALALSLSCSPFLSVALAGETATAFGRVVELSGASFWTRTDAHGQFELGNLKVQEAKAKEIVVWPGIRCDHPSVLAYGSMEGPIEDLGPTTVNSR